MIQNSSGLDANGEASPDKVTGGASGAPPSWWIYQGNGSVLDVADRDRRWPLPPQWRSFSQGPDVECPPADEREFRRRLGDLRPLRVDAKEVSMVNAAIYLRRPLLVTGRPGAGKSSLAYRIARELRLGPVLRWPITSRTTLRSGLYEYDAIGRAQAVGWRTTAVSLAGGASAGHGVYDADLSIGDFLHLGPLGTALLPYRLPRVLLIDEMDKSDFDLPNDLLNIFEDGEFAIPELVRLRNLSPEVTVHTADRGSRAAVRDGIVRCHEFPVVIITSNGEREFSGPFMRRCLQLEIPDPDADRLVAMVAAHFPHGVNGAGSDLVAAFLERRRRSGSLAVDQLLHAVYLATSGAFQPDDLGSWHSLLDSLWSSLSTTGP